MGTRGCRRRGRHRREKVKYKERDCAEWLPDEVWDLILNGTDSHERAFMAPHERPLLRLVSPRWCAIIENPQPSWATGHLERAARLALSDQTGFVILDRDALGKLRRAFVRGRVVMASSAVLFVRGPSWHPSRICVVSGHVLPTFNDPERGRTADAQTTCCGRTTDRTIARLGEYLSLVGAPITDRRDRMRLNALTGYLVGDACLVSHGDNGTPLPSKSQMRVLDDVAPCLALLGHPFTALRVYRQWLGTAVDIVKVIDLFKRCLVSMIRSGVDDPRAFFAALSMSGCKFMTALTTLGCFGSVSNIQRALFEAGAARSLHALLVAVRNHDATPTAPHQQMQAGIVSHAPSERALGHPPPCDYRSIVMFKRGKPFSFDGRFGNALAHEVRAIDAQPDDKRRGEWIPYALHGADPLGMLAVCGARPEDLGRAISIALCDEDTALADRIAAMSHKDQVWCTPSCFARAIVLAGSPRLSADWFARRCIGAPLHGHVAAALELTLNQARSRTHIGWHVCVPDIIAALAAMWPTHLLQQRPLLERVLSQLLIGSHWKQLASVIDHLTPLVTIALSERDIINVDPAPSSADSPLADTHSRRHTIWASVADGTILPYDIDVSACATADAARRCVSDVKGNEDDTVAITVDLGDILESPHTYSASYLSRDQIIIPRTIVLAKLAFCCDPRTNPDNAHAWRFWCGEPTPVRPYGHERAAAMLSERGLYL